VDETGQFLADGAGFDPELYEGQMRFVDRQFGEMLETLKASGKFENALIIVCSDHSLKTETDPRILATPGWIYHVPLMIKWPGQHRPRTIDRPLSLTQIQPLITAAMDGATLEEAIKAVNRLPLPTVHTRTGIVEAPP
jgi:arylsulfatase A-like enzyme